jgi:hypothetical protein
MLLAIGGFLCGLLAGAAARYGRVCSMSAIEDALLARDYRAAKAWGLALAVAVLITLMLSRAGLLDVGATAYAVPRLDVLGALLGGLIFGFGMALIGTCSFGLLVRAGGGDMRAVVSALVVGISAFAATAGVLAPGRTFLSAMTTVDLAPVGGALLPDVMAHLSTVSRLQAELGVAAFLSAVLLGAVVLDKRLRRRPRLLLSAAVLGAAVGAGWLVTSLSVARLESPRPESLSFVAPVGRLLLQIMSDTLRDIGFGVASVAGVVCGATATALLKREVRWEAFDDAREMRRHMLGAVLMGLGGVLARGCTIGQGMSAASTLAVSAPIVVVGVVIGAKVGLVLLLEGRAMWRLGANA